MTPQHHAVVQQISENFFMRIAHMENSQFKRRIAHGMLGIAWSHGFLYHLDIITESAIAFLKIEDWSFHAPIFFGDTLHVEITVQDIVNSRSKPDRGILKLFFQLINQNETVCQSGTKCIMMKRHMENQA